MRFVLFIIVSFLLGACSSGDAFNGGENEKKPDSDGKAFIVSRDEDAKATRIFSGNYHFKIRRKSDSELLCQGDAKITYYSNGNTKTTGTAPCTNAAMLLVGTKEIKISDVLSAESVALSLSERKEFKLDPRITFVKSTGGTKYEPYKPELLGPVIQDVRSFTGLNQSFPIKTVHETGDPKSPLETDDGIVKVEVLNAGMSYQPDGYFERFDNVLHWRLSSTGFEKVRAKSDAKLYSIYEYHWNVKPIVILNVHIEGSVKDFERSILKGLAGDVLFGGGLMIDLTLRDFAQISEQ